MIDLRSRGIATSEITWSKVKEIQPRRKGEKICGLCNMEKIHIAVGDPAVILNKRSEIMERCRHRDALVLINDLRRERNVMRNPLVVCYNDDASEGPAAIVSSSMILPRGEVQENLFLLI